MKQPQDFIFLKGLRVSARIGCSKEERSFPQLLHIDAKMGLDIRKPSESGSIDDTVCYDKLRQLLIEEAGRQEWTLVEELAESLAQISLTTFKLADNILVKVSKNIFPDCEFAGTEIFRSRTSTK